MDEWNSLGWRVEETDCQSGGILWGLAGYEGDVVATHGEEERYAESACVGEVSRLLSLGWLTGMVAVGDPYFGACGWEWRASAGEEDAPLWIHLARLWIWRCNLRAEHSPCLGSFPH